MLRALLERGVVPDLVVGTSVGALNGVAVAAEPSLAAVDSLERTWNNLSSRGVFSASVVQRATTLARSRTHLHSNQPLRALLERTLPVHRFEDLTVAFQCVAASVERAAEHWFSQGPLVPAVLASSAVPGLLPAVRIGNEHFVDGGVVNSIPVDRAVELGATELYVLHVGRIERPLAAPRNLWQVAVATVTFEISRRHRFQRGISSLPDGVVAHVLPTGEDTPPRYDRARDQMAYRDTSKVAAGIERAHRATAAYLDALG
jgi:NTE family protein